MSVKKTLPGHCVDNVRMDTMAFPIVFHANVHHNLAHFHLPHVTRKLETVSARSDLLGLHVNSVILVTTTIQPVRRAHAVILELMRPFVMPIQLCWSVSALNDLLVMNVASVQLAITHFQLVLNVRALHPVLKWKMASTWLVIQPAVNVCAKPSILVWPVMNVPMASS